MDKVETETKLSLVELTTDVVSAYVAHNSVQKADVVDLISSVYASLSSLGTARQDVAAERPQPAVSIKKSVMPDYLISLEDGRRYKSLKRHLAGRGMTPEQYRSKWGLTADYPMVAPSYAKQRSELAKSMGLGRKRRPVEAPEPAPPAALKGRRTAKRNAG